MVADQLVQNYCPFEMIVTVSLAEKARRGFPYTTIPNVVSSKNAPKLISANSHKLNHAHTKRYQPKHHCHTRKTKPKSVIIPRAVAAAAENTTALAVGEEDSKTVVLASLAVRKRTRRLRMSAEGSGFRCGRL